MRIAVVIPAFNEAGNIGRLDRGDYRGGSGRTFCRKSSSSTMRATTAPAPKSRRSARHSMRHCAISAMAQRAGQSAALRSGVIAAKAPVIATMDGDGQNDPADIMRLLAKLGPEGRRAGDGGRHSAKAARPQARAKLASRFANWIRDKVLADGCPDTGCGLKIYWRDAYLGAALFHPACTVICRPCFSPTATKSPMSRSTIGRGSGARRNTPISGGPHRAI